LKRPYIVIKREIPEPREAAAKIIPLVEENKVESLNVGGPRASG
jgi:hypothetical protein